MEQKRTLWIVASVGIFLLVVLGGMLIFYKPQARSVQTIAQTSLPARSSSDGWVNPPVDSSSSNRSETAQQSENVGVLITQENGIDNVPNTVQTQNATQDAQTIPTAQVQSETQSIVQPSVANVNDMTVYSQNTTVYGTATSGGTNAQRAEAAGGTVIDLNAPRGTRESDTTLATTNETTSQVIANARTTEVPAQSATITRRSTAPSSANTATNANVAASATASSTAAARPAPTTTSTSASATSVAKTPAVTATRQTQYWVQAASFANKNGADNARSTLDSNKIPSDIFTYKDNKGNVFYRVRVGPYTTKSEAEYWRTRVAQISDFQTTESYVTQTTTVN